MYHSLLKTTKFHVVLVTIDDDLANKTRQNPCAYCGGPLHQANYPRSPLGLPEPCRDYYQQRYSFCCGDCRKRVTIPSVRFFGRRRFPAAVMVLISAFMSDNLKRGYSKVRRFFGVAISLRTWVRWRRWWQECFTNTNFWKQAKATLPPDNHNGPYPRKLFLNYPNRLNKQLEMVLQFLAPLTAGVYRAV